MPPAVLRISRLAVMCVLFQEATALAQDDPEETTTETTAEEAEQLYNLELEDLLNIDVTTASKRTENEWDAPSVVTVVTAEEIKMFGARNLMDVLDRLTSTQTFGSNMIPENVVSVRGSTFQHENNHVLFLLNGRPFRDSASYGYVSSLLAGFPIELIERIEVIRGPGSVLYGSAAFAGVFNIVTKQASKLDLASLSATVGSFDSRYMQGHVAFHDKDWSVILGGKSLRSDGWVYDYTDPAGTHDQFRTNDDDFGTTILANYQDFTLNGFIGRSEQTALEPTGLFPTRLHSLENEMLDLGYKHPLTRTWAVQANATYNRFSFGPLQIWSNDAIAEASVGGPIIKDLNLLVGSTFELDQYHEGQTAVQNANTENKQRATGYVQLDYKVLPWLKVVAAAQYNKPFDLAGNLSPRVAAIANFPAGYGVKLLYGDAYRSATNVERFVDAPGIIHGNPDLRPEGIGTAEIQAFYHKKQYSLALTGYRSVMSDLIKRVGFPIAFVNAGHIRFYGVEFEGKASLTKEVAVFANAAYQRSTDDNGVDDSTLAPNVMAKIGGYYNAPCGYSLGAFASAFGTPHPVTVANPMATNYDPVAKGYQLVTLNARVDLNKLFFPDKPPMELSLFVDNVLDREIRYPDINGFQVNSIPIHPGISAYGTLTLRY